MMTLGKLKKVRINNNSTEWCLIKRLVILQKPYSNFENNKMQNILLQKAYR
ncbi:hypothetical protein CHRYSEOSP005_21560 [Chryseobacterium sp. Alg-005]